ncbi:MAG: LysM peptidoglycan-binding domain-containing protein [Chlamydiae bacterium]|nr:LysM peptidoglycan-binding domain-containing protein [Chlamydiota bacterium]
MKFFYIFFLLVLASCANRSQEKEKLQAYNLSVVQSEVKDLLHKMDGLQSTIAILEEQIAKLKNTKGNQKEPEWEKRLVTVEKMQEKIAVDLKNIRDFTGQISHQVQNQMQELQNRLDHFRDTIQEIGKIRTTLSSLSKTMGESQIQIVKVKPGDSLEKIAKQHHTTIENLKTLNNLTQDTIFIGQELKVP